MRLEAGGNKQGADWSVVPPAWVATALHTCCLAVHSWHTSCLPPAACRACPLTPPL